MADSVVQLPYTATTSGDLLDATSLVIGGNTVKRERMVIGNDTSSHVTIVTTSGALSVQIQNQAVVIAQLSGGISSGLVTLSSNPVTGQVVSLSSGLVTLSSNPVAGQVVSLSSGTVTLSSTPVIVSASSGFVQVYQSTSPWTVINSSAGLLSAFLMGSSGGTVFVTTSGALSVTISTAAGGAGSTAVSIAGGAGVIAPATSSYGLLMNTASTTSLIGTMTATVGAPVLQILTTKAAYLYSFAITSTVNAPGNIVDIFSATSSLSSEVGLIRVATIFGTVTQSLRGIYMSNGISMLCKITAATTGSNNCGALVVAEYSV